VYFVTPVSDSNDKTRMMVLQTVFVMTLLSFFVPRTRLLMNACLERLRTNLRIHLHPPCRLRLAPPYPHPHHPQQVHQSQAHPHPHPHPHLSLLMSSTLRLGQLPTRASWSG
jgi:hypothetical protein